MVPSWRLRAEFAQSMSAVYGTEVPAYTTLLDVCAEVNAAVLRADGARARRLGEPERVHVERHGAIRVGTPGELAQVARVFGAMGMYPVGFYDLRDAARSAVPVVSTAFRPIAADELARNPFRMFTSLLTPADRRFFDEDLEVRIGRFLAGRRLFGAELLDLADRAERDGGLVPEAARRFVTLATAAFALSREPIDRAWYAELSAVSAVAADIAGVTSTHINHLTPRVLDIDLLYARMGERGIAMIDRIQGPPRWDGPDVLLRQTSFRALDEHRPMREPDGTIGTGAVRVRFGEVESRGIALTPAGRAHYDAALVEADTLAAASPVLPADAARAVWEQRFPREETQLVLDGLGYATFTAASGARPREGRDLAGLLADGALQMQPIVYEDFLPRSAAGIFQSNLTGEGRKDGSRSGTLLDAGWMAGVLDRPLHDPYALYAAQQDRSLRGAAHALGLAEPPPLVAAGAETARS
ncbi:DUF1338 domain-containing protein [Pseudonocardia sp. CNS-139]|nr:DUF1338 domain-containing protein [Pseudonocardia sp. CNS-139]